MFKWTPSMQVDDGPIDADHQHLISLANRVLELDRPNRDAEALKQIIRQLYDYVKTHFLREEGLMQKFGYPELEAHKLKHAAIVKEMNQYLTSSHHMAEMLSNFRHLVNKWVVNHIMEEDLKIHRFLKHKQAGTGSKPTSD